MVNKVNVGAAYDAYELRPAPRRRLAAWKEADVCGLSLVLINLSRDLIKSFGF